MVLNCIEPSLHGSHDPAMEIGEALGEVIDRNRAEIERRWLKRVQEDVVKTPGVEPTALRDGMPDYLTALVKMLSGREPLERTSQDAWKRVASEHGVTRVRLGFDIGQLIHEFILLRHVIRQVAGEQGLAQEAANSLLADILDAAIVVSVQAYIDARDFQMRAAQAQNIGFLTHELGNPLQAAGMATTRLRSIAQPAQLRTLELIERAHTQLQQLIQSVLLTQKLESGQVVSHPRRVSFAQVLEPALESARVMAERKGLDFRVQVDPNLQVRVDPDLTRSALQNLVDNAAKYTSAGHVEVSVEDRPTELQVHVRDTCHGLSPEELRTIFEPFKRGRTTQQGTGLGLAIARRAVEAQGGKIGAESPGPEGCHFWITLPKS
jgi:two-component system sensor histidine kinase BarA